MPFASRHRAALALAGLALLGAVPAQAQGARVLGDFRDWSAYSATEPTGGAVCFALSKPKKVSPQPDGYGQAYLYLTHRPAENVSNELNLVAGFAFALDTPATASVGGQSFQLFTQNDAAWLEDPAQGDALASAMRAGSTLVIEATTDKGIRVTETFSLSGATAASKAIDSQC